MSNVLPFARYKLSPTQLKMILFVMARVRVSDEAFKSYEIPIKEIMEVIGLSPEGIYTSIKTEAEALMREVLVFEKKTPTGFKQFDAMHWFSFFHYLEGTGAVQVQFDPHLRPHLLELKGCFSTFALKYVLGLRSFYSIRIYQMLKKEAAFKTSCALDLETFKRELKIEKIPTYKNFGALKRRILGPALREIGEKTDLKIIGFKEKKAKKGKKIEGFTVFFAPQVPPKEREERELALESLKSSATYDEILESFDPDPIIFPEPQK